MTSDLDQVGGLLLSATPAITVSVLHAYTDTRSQSLSSRLHEKLNTNYLLLHSNSAMLQMTHQAFSWNCCTCEVLALHNPTPTKRSYSSRPYYLTPISLFIHDSFILQISTAFTTSLSPLILLLLSSVPISRALQPFIPFPNSSDPLCITSSEPWTLSGQHPKFPSFGPRCNRRAREGKNIVC